MSSTPGERELSAPERAYRELRQAILEGAIPPGERLTTLALAEKLGVSRTPIRAALVRLEAEGLIDTEGGRSARVRPLTVDDVEHAYDVGMALEGVSVLRLAERSDTEQCRALKETVEAMAAAAAASDRRSWVEADKRFHELLAELSENHLLWQTMQRVENVIGRLRYLSLQFDPNSALTSAQEHGAVVSALCAGDGNRARELHHGHWNRVRKANVGILREGFLGTGSFLISASSRWH